MNIGEACDAPTVSRREAAKQERRERILKATAELICSEGVDEVRLANVAKLADVTVPTIHNLFGKKKDVFQHLIQYVGEAMIELARVNSKDLSLEGLEDGIERLFLLLEENEKRFKAGFIVGERYGFLGLEDESFRHAAQAAADKRKENVEKSILKGDLDLFGLSELLMDRYRSLRSNWMIDKLSTAEFKRKFLWALYAVMMADAGDSLKKSLLDRINKLSNNTA